MTRLIDADELITTLDEELQKDSCSLSKVLLAGFAKQILNAAPTVDAVEVVKCKDCKHSYDAIGGTFCSYGICVDCLVDVDFFCKNGER